MYIQHTHCSKRPDIVSLGHYQAVYMHLFPEDFWQWSCSLGDLPNILGKVGRAGIGFGTAQPICCQHQRNMRQLLCSRNTLLCQFLEIQAVLYIKKHMCINTHSARKHTDIVRLTRYQAICMHLFLNISLFAW